MIELNAVFGGIESGLRNPLLKCYQAIVSNYVERRWEPAELNGGKLAEIVYTIIADILHGTASTSPAKPRNMLAACQALEKIPADASRVGDRSLRILIPRMLPVLYEIRNNRNVGHVGGDVDPDFMDATAVYSMASWLMAELVRVFHNISTKEAQETVDALVERKHLVVWLIGDKKRVLDPKMPIKDQVLVLLHQSASAVDQTVLRNWVEYQNSTNFRSKILAPLHKARLIEWNQQTAEVHISPLGVSDVEQRLLKS